MVFNPPSSRTVLGPLTTTFTAPTLCDYALVACTDLSCNGGWRAQGCYSNGVVFDESTCWPPASNGAPTPTPPFEGWGFYSPGVYCPAGFTSACRATAGGHTGWSIEYPLVPGETAVGCCPTGFSCATNVDGAETCQQIATGSMAVSVASCSYGTIEGTRELTLPYTVEVTPSGSASASESASMSLVSHFKQYAPMIDIRWQASDLKSLSTTPTPGPTGSAKPGASVSGASATSSPSSSKSSSGLSTGAIAGIAVAGAVVLIAAIIAAFFLLRKRKKSQTEKAEWPTPNPTVAAHQGEPQERHEVKGSPVYELGSTRDVHEMASQKQLLYERPEMNGSSPGES